MTGALLAPGEASLILFGLFFGLLLLRVPVAVALGLSCLPVLAIEERLSRVDAIRSGLGGGALVPPLSGAIDELDARREKVAGIVETYGDARQFLPVFLGFSAPTCYLVLAHNNAELLPTGGLVSVLGQMCLDRGRMTAFEFTDAADARWHCVLATSAPAGAAVADVRLTVRQP